MQKNLLKLFGILVLFFISTFALPITTFDKDIPKEEYAERRAKVMETLSDGGIIFRDGKIGRGMDSVDRNTPILDFYYLTGYHKEDSYIVLIPSEKKTILFAKEENEDELKKIGETTGISDVKSAQAFQDFVKKNLKETKKFYIKVEHKIEKTIKDTIKDVEIDTKRLSKTLVKLRLIKSEAEQRCMKKAAQATAKGLIEAMKNVKPDMVENELQKIIEDVFKKETGGKYTAFPSIVASGVNSLELHYSQNSRKMKDGELVLCDVGSEYQFYASDVTRTFPINGKFTEEQKEIYELCLGAMKKAEEKLKPGVSLGELHLIAEDYVQKNSNGKYKLGHSLSHYVGLAVHDYGADGKLKAGMVITIEPGIYIPQKKFGIRIEDTYLVTKDGFERLSSDIPREINEIEKLMKK